MISRERMEKALTFLAETDSKCGYHKTHVEKMKLKAKAIYGAQYLLTEGTVDERKSMAENSKAHQDALESYFEAMNAYEALKNKRDTEALVIDVWRTLEASRRKNNI